MDEESFNISIRKFLKTVGVGAQREIEQAVDQAIRDGRIKGTETFPVSATLHLGELKLEVRFDGEIKLQ